MAGVALMAAAVVAGDWEAHPIRYLGLTALGQTWMAAVASLALWVYGRAEALEKQAAAAQSTDPSGAGLAHDNASGTDP